MFTVKPQCFDKWNMLGICQCLWKGLWTKKLCRPNLAVIRNSLDNHWTTITSHLIPLNHKKVRRNRVLLFWEAANIKTSNSVRHIFHSSLDSYLESTICYPWRGKENLLRIALFSAGVIVRGSCDELLDDLVPYWELWWCYSIFLGSRLDEKWRTVENKCKFHHHTAVIFSFFPDIRHSCQNIPSPSSSTISHGICRCFEWFIAEPVKEGDFVKQSLKFNTWYLGMKINDAIICNVLKW